MEIVKNIIFLLTAGAFAALIGWIAIIITDDARNRIEKTCDIQLGNSSVVSTRWHTDGFTDRSEVVVIQLDASGERAVEEKLAGRKRLNVSPDQIFYTIIERVEGQESVV